MSDPLLKYVRGRHALRAFLRRHLPLLQRQPSLHVIRIELEYTAGTEVLTSVEFAEDEESADATARILLRFVPGDTGPTYEDEVLIHEEPSLQVFTCEFPDDGRLPSLRTALSPKYARELLDRFSAGESGTASVEVLSYTPYNRAVLRYGKDGGALVGKLYESEEAAERVWAALQHIAANADLTPEPLMYDPALPLVLTRVAAGETLDEYLHRPMAVSLHRQAVRRTAAALHRLHTLPAGDIAPASFESEYGTLHTKRGTIEPGYEAIPEQGWKLLERAAIPEVPASEHRLIHGGFKPPQVILSDEAVLLVDLDGCGTGDPAWDLGRFMAKLRGDSVDDHRARLRHYEDDFLAAYVALAGGDLREWAARARRFQVLELVRMAFSRLSTHPPGTFRFRKNHSQQFLQQAEQVMEAAEHL